MKAIVVYESLWGNTAAIARAIAEGIGPGAQAHAFSLPTEQPRRNAGGNAGQAPPPDLSHPPCAPGWPGLPSGRAVPLPSRRPSAGRPAAPPAGSGKPCSARGTAPYRSRSAS